MLSFYCEFIHVLKYRKKNSRALAVGLHVLQSVLHVVQVGWGYLLMLVAMSFNGWLFLSVCFGAGVGFFLFAWLKNFSVSTQDKNEHCHWTVLFFWILLAWLALLVPVPCIISCILCFPLIFKLYTYMWCVLPCCGFVLTFVYMTLKFVEVWDWPEPFSCTCSLKPISTNLPCHNVIKTLEPFSLETWLELLFFLFCFFP